MLKWTAILTLSLSLAACDGGNSQPTQVKSVKATGAYIEKLKALSPQNQGLALRRAIQDSGARCKRVLGSGYQQDYENLSLWTARCSDTKDWAVFIAPNGDVQVRKCSEAAQLKLPQCRLPEGTPAA